MTTIEFTPRVWRGRVTSLRQSYTSAFGMRLYEVWFKDKKAYFEISSKRTNPIHVGHEIRFSGHFVECPNRYFYITDVYDSTYMDLIESAEQERRIKILQEESYEQRNI